MKIYKECCGYFICEESFQSTALFLRKRLNLLFIGSASVRKFKFDANPLPNYFLYNLHYCCGQWQPAPAWCCLEHDGHCMMVCGVVIQEPCDITCPRGSHDPHLHTYLGLSGMRRAGAAGARRVPVGCSTPGPLLSANAATNIVRIKDIYKGVKINSDISYTFKWYKRLTYFLWGHTIS